MKIFFQLDPIKGRRKDICLPQSFARRTSLRAIVIISKDLICDRKNNVEICMHACLVVSLGQGVARLVISHGSALGVSLCRAALALKCNNACALILANNYTRKGTHSAQNRFQKKF